MCCVYVRMCVCICKCISHNNYINYIIDCLGLPGAPPSPSLSVVNVTMVRVRWETPVDTGNLNISHFQVCVRASNGEMSSSNVHH